MAALVTKERDPGSATIRDTLKERPRVVVAHGGEEERCILKTWLWNGRRAPALPDLNQESITQ